PVDALVGNAYSVFMMLTKAMQEAGTVEDTNAVRLALERIEEFEGINGKYGWEGKDTYGINHQLKSPIYIAEGVRGKVKVIATLPAQGVFPQQESEITLTFFNMDNSLLRDIRYNVKFFDENNNMIFETDRYTPEGIDVIKHTFEKEGMVTMQINVIGSGFSMQKIDTSIAGTAETSISVVPEFPVAVVIISIGMIAAIAIARRNNILKVN
ncbi:MAG: hypothetical protein QW050_00935, partial [Candidatus Nitrosocaldaceae archaeon]